MEENKTIQEKIKNSGHRLGKEFKKSISTAIISAFSLIVALAWKDVITGYVTKIQSVAPVKGQVISALFLTLISVIGIVIVSKLLGEKEK
jgi:preprotein translocase subunit SecD